MQDTVVSNKYLGGRFMSKKGVSLALLIVFAITNIMLPSAFGISIAESSPITQGRPVGCSK